MGKSYERKMMVPTQVGHVWRRCHQVLGALPGVSGIVAEPGVVRATVNVNWKSWGEEITVTLAEGAGGTDVLIRSQCAFAPQLIDWGRNKENVDRIARGLVLPAPAQLNSPHQNPPH